MNSAKLEKVALALGSNMGDRQGALRSAIKGMESFVKLTAQSPVYETPPVYVTDQPAFLNMAVLGETALEPLVLLRALKQLEADLGRTPTFHYGPRVIDMDIIFYGDQIYDKAELKIPHPRLAEREFVLRPLADIATGWRHPQNNLTVQEMLAQLPDSKATCLGSL